MKLLSSVFATLIFILPQPSLQAAPLSDQPDLSELVDQPVTTNLFQRYNQLNSQIRDNLIVRSAARRELDLLLKQISIEYFRSGGGSYNNSQWIFPVAGYDHRAITGGRRKGYIASGYDFFSGNRHGGHPAFDIFIRDKRKAGVDERTGKPAQILSMTGGVVVALEKEWDPSSRLRGGKYLWIYDPANQLLVYYAHNSELLVGLGDLVRPGDPIALMGRTGYNAAKHRSPTHLHLSVLKVKDGMPLPENVYLHLQHALKKSY